MDLVRSIRSAIMRAMASTARAERRRVAAETARRRAQLPHRVLYFHQVDDPYSQLAAQALEPFMRRYDVELQPRVVARPTPIAIHEQALWDAWAQRDCAAIAPYYGLRYESATTAPDPQLVARARRIAVRAETHPGFAALAVELGTALAHGVAQAVAALEQRHGAATAEAVDAHLQRNFDERHRLGHYLGAMFHYAGEWYWGVDRLHYLEERLDALGARRPDAPAGPSVALRRPELPAAMAGCRRLKLEFFPSVRSPYTHLAYDRVAELVRRYPVDLVLRPVLPMMMRGVKADRRKGQYILQDTRREADRLGIPFGEIWDPFGKPVRRAYSLYDYARRQGRGLEFLQAYSRAVWSERIDASGEKGLRQILQRAGLDWDQARPLLDNCDWEEEFERNVQDMIAAGSWGVPTLRLPAADGFDDFTVWGQDRIWLVEAEIAKRLVQQAPGKHYLHNV